MAPFWILSEAMPNLSIKNVPVDVVEKLRQRAAANHRSLQGELMVLVCEAAGPGTGSRKPTTSLQGTRSVEEISARHRERWPEPLDGAPRAVDIIRKERDAR